MGLIKNDKELIFQNAVESTGNGTEYSIEYKTYGVLTLVLSIKSTGGTNTVNFEVADFNGNWTSLVGYNSATGNSAASTTNASNEKWKFSLEGFAKFRTRISAIASGALTITGNLVGS